MRDNVTKNERRPREQLKIIPDEEKREVDLKPRQ